MDLASYPHGRLSDEAEVVTLSFPSAVTVGCKKQVTSETNATDVSLFPPRQAKEKIVAVQVTNAGVLVGVAYWFWLHYHGNSTLSTGPDGYPGVSFGLCVC